MLRFIDKMSVWVSDMYVRACIRNVVSRQVTTFNDKTSVCMLPILKYEINTYTKPNQI